jgi:hypothetical protein
MELLISYEGVSESFFRTGRLERELQMVQLSATICSCIAIFLVSLVRFPPQPFVLLLNNCCCLFRYRLSPENFGYTLVCVSYTSWNKK